MRHVALNVKDAQASKRFYTDVLKMQVEWEPDPQNVYLTTAGQDNLAIHEQTGDADADSAGQRLDHIGFALPTLESVDEWYAWIRTQISSLGLPQVKILREVKTHRDGARSFYFSDPDGVVIQMIFHPPIAAAANSQARR